MVSVRSIFAVASMALVATVSAFPADGHHRTLQAVNFRQDLLDNINAARKKEGLDELCLNEMLMDAAQIQANDMAENNFIKSTGSDGSVPKDRAAEQGFKAETVTEIVGAGYRTAASVVAAWTKAASAKNTIFGKVNVMGPGYTFDKTRKYVHFWAVDFSTGECGNGTATGGPGPAASGDASGSVELPSSGSDDPKSNDASGNDDESGSGAPAPAGTPAVTPAPAGSGTPSPASAPAGTPAPAGSDDENSGSDKEEPAATPAPADSDQASGSDDPPAAAPGAAPAAAPAPGAAPAVAPAPAPGAAPAAAPAPGAETPASGSGAPPSATPAPAEDEPETPQ